MQLQPSNGIRESVPHREKSREGRGLPGSSSRRACWSERGADSRSFLKLGQYDVERGRRGSDSESKKKIFAGSVDSPSGAAKIRPVPFGKATSPQRVRKSGFRRLTGLWFLLGTMFAGRLLKVGRRSLTTWLVETRSQSCERSQLRTRFASPSGDAGHLFIRETNIPFDRGMTSPSHEGFSKIDSCCSQAACAGSFGVWLGGLSINCIRV